MNIEIEQLLLTHSINGQRCIWKEMLFVLKYLRNYSFQVFQNSVIFVLLFLFTSFIISASSYTHKLYSSLQTCSPPALVLSLSPGLGSISDGVPSPGAGFYRPSSRTSPHFRPASRTPHSPPSRLGTSSPCNDLLMAMTNSQGIVLI